MADPAALDPLTVATQGGGIVAVLAATAYMLINFLARHGIGSTGGDAGKTRDAAVSLVSLATRVAVLEQRASAHETVSERNRVEMQAEIAGLRRQMHEAAVEVATAVSRLLALVERLEAEETARRAAEDADRRASARGDTRAGEGRRG